MYSKSSTVTFAVSLIVLMKPFPIDEYDPVMLLFVPPRMTFWLVGPVATGVPPEVYVATDG